MPPPPLDPAPPDPLFPEYCEFELESPPFPPSALSSVASKVDEAFKPGFIRQNMIAGWVAGADYIHALCLLLNDI
jgi:hypothetical protein